MVAERFADVIGAYLREARREHGITLEQVVNAARRHGASWSVSSVQALEAGKASPTLPNLLFVALVIGALTEETISLADLFSKGRLYDLPRFDGQPASREWLMSALSGARVEAPAARDAKQRQRGYEGWPEYVDRVLFDDEVEQAVAARGHAPLTQAEKDSQLDALLEESRDPERGFSDRGGARPGLAVKRAASKLGISPLDLERQAVRLWGRTLEAESRDRAGFESTAQARGRVTRLLVEELRNSLGEG